MPTADITLIPFTTELLALLPRDRAAFVARCGHRVSAEWPNVEQLEALSFFLSMREQYPDEEAWQFLILRRSDDCVIGGIGRKGPISPSGEVEVGYGVVPSACGAGVATAALAQFLTFAFAEPAITAVTAETLVSNAASIGVLQRNGFAEAGARTSEEGPLRLWRLLRMERNLPLHIKGDQSLPVQGVPAPFTLGAFGAVTYLSIDGRQIPMSSYAGAPLDEVALCIARVPSRLRDVLTGIVISPNPNPADGMWAEKYRLPVLSGMGAVADGSGWVFIYPHGIAQLDSPDKDAFVRGLMHELGHCWSLHEWGKSPSAKEAWLNAIASDHSAPSLYAVWSFRSSGSPDEDVAEATALYLLVLGTPAFDVHRATMPARFALLDARFGQADF